jgi:hypothetical protein
MSELEAAPPVPKLEFAPVVQGAFGVLKRNLATFVGLAGILQGLPLLVLVFGALAAGSGTPLAAAGPMSLGGLLLLLGSLVLAPGVIHGAFTDLSGRKPTIAECVRSGLRHAIPVFFIMMCVGVAAAFAALLLIFPAIMLGVAWSVATPARVVERTGVFASIGRSGELTRGSRWRIFWLFFLWFIVGGAIQQTFLGLVGMGTTGTMVSTTGRLGALASGYGVVALVITVASTLVTYTGLAVIYYELRRLKEGIGPDALASIFD